MAKPLYAASVEARLPWCVMAALNALPVLAKLLYEGFAKARLLWRSAIRRLFRMRLVRR